MICNDGFELTSNSLCVEKHGNPYVNRLVDSLMDMDRGFTHGRTFLDYGAHHSHRINGKELMDKMVPRPQMDSDEKTEVDYRLERAKAVDAMITVFEHLDLKKD